MGGSAARGGPSGGDGITCVSFLVGGMVALGTAGGAVIVAAEGGGKARIQLGTPAGPQAGPVASAAGGASGVGAGPSGEGGSSTGGRGGGGGVGHPVQVMATNSLRRGAAWWWQEGTAPSTFSSRQTRAPGRVPENAPSLNAPTLSEGLLARAPLSATRAKLFQSASSLPLAAKP